MAEVDPRSIAERAARMRSGQGEATGELDPQDIAKRAQAMRQGADMPEPTERSFGERLGKGIDDTLAAFAQGALRNYGDEIAAWINTNLLGEGTYEENLTKAQERYEQVPPEIQIPGEIAGGISTYLAAAPYTAGVQAPRAIAQLPGWLKAAGLGGVEGALYASGATEGDLAERGRAAIGGGALGFGTGGVLYPAAKGVGYLADKTRGALRQRFTPELAARAKVAQNIARDEMTPARVRTRLRELGPQATIADAGGRNVMSAARDIAGVPGPAGNRAEMLLNQRAEAEGTRIARAVGRSLDPEDFYAAQDAFLNNMKERAAPLYQQAYEAHQSIMTPRLKRLLTSRYGQQALKEVAKITEAERAAGASKYLGKVDEELTQAMRDAVDVGKMESVGRPGVIRGFSLETWDQVKRGFDALLDKPAYRNEMTGKLNKLGHAVDQMRRTLLKELDKVTGGERSVYAQARKVYGGEAEALRALTEGRKAINKDPEIITRELASLSEAAQDAYRSGFARALKDTVDKTGDMNSAARKLFGNARSRARIRAVMPDQQNYNLLAKALIAEGRFAQTRAQVSPSIGSLTAMRQKGTEDVLSRTAGNLGAIIGSQGPGHALVASGVGRRLAQAAVGGSDEAYNKALSRILFNRNQAMNQQVLDALESGTLWEGMSPEMKRRIGESVLLAITQQEGKAVAR